jgi:uncharacterized protein YjbI with pentapeptide repeats
MELRAAERRVVVMARLELAAPVGGILCRVAPAATPPLLEGAPLPDEGASVVLRGLRRRTVTLFEGAERVLVADGASAASGRLELAYPRLGEATRLVIDDPARAPARAWQLPGIAPRVRLRLPDGDAAVVALRAVALHVDLDDGALALHWRGVLDLPRGAAGWQEEVIGVEAGFVPSIPVSVLTAELAAPPTASPALAPPLDNRTALVATSFPWQLRPPANAWIVVVKGTFDLLDGAPARPATEPAPLQGEVLHPGGVSLAYPGDFAPMKPRADVILNGHAHARPGAALARVELRVGPLVSSLVVLGPRRWLSGGQPSEPEPFDRLPLRWEHAFGGPEVAANPVGVGAPPSTSVPRIERPEKLLQRRGDRPPPAGFAAIPPAWAPRAAALGTYGAAWQEARWPFFPEDFDWSYWNAAPAELTVPWLRGDEEYRVTSVRPSGGDLAGRLPGIWPRCFATREGGALGVEVPLRLDTLVIDADRAQMILVWRGAIEATSGAAAPRGLLVIEDPVDAPRPLEEVERLLAAAPADAELKVPVVSALLREIQGALDARRPAPGSDLRARAASIARVAPAAPRARRGDVERWIAAGERLAGRDLSGVDLSGLDLSGRDLSGAVLRGAILDDARLDGALCEGLRAADLRARRSSWKGARLSRADLTRADLEGADLSEAALDQATFADAELAGVVARGASGASVQLVRARLSRAIFDEARLPKADLSHATLDGASFRAAVLDDARLHEALAEGLVADRASLVDARFELARLDGASFREARARGAMWERASLAGADFTGADLREASFTAAALAGARFGGADLQRARLDGSVLVGASLSRANLMAANLAGADATRADFSGANLYRAETWGARLDGARLDGAMIKGTKLDRR